MAKPVIAKAKMLILSRIHHHFTKLPTIRQQHHYHYHHHHRLEEEEVRKSIDEAKMENESCWVPHPRTGIYMPKGHERVMESVPKCAASFDQSYWLRDVDGVDRNEPNVPA